MQRKCVTETNHEKNRIKSKLYSKFVRYDREKEF